MNSEQRARSFAIAAIAAAVVLALVIAWATNHAVWRVLLIVGGFIAIVGLVLALIGTLRRAVAQAL